MFTYIEQRFTVETTTTGEINIHTHTYTLTHHTRTILLHRELFSISLNEQSRNITKQHNNSQHTEIIDATE